MTGWIERRRQYASRGESPPKSKGREDLWWPLGSPRRKQIHRTATGLAILTIVLLVSWIPPLQAFLLLRFLLVVAEIVGVVFVILGRHGFGPAHAQNVVFAVVLWFVGLGVLAWYVIGLAVILRPVASSGPSGPSILPSLEGLLVLGAVVQVVIGSSWILFGHALLRWRDRALLYGSLAVSLALYIVVARIVRSAVQSLLAGDHVTARALLGDATDLAVFGFVPNMMLVVAYVTALIRIDRKEIPTPPFKECPSCKCIIDAAAIDCFVCGHRFGGTTA